MGFSVGQMVQSAGCVTRLRDIIGRQPEELEDIIGYHRGRLAQGYLLAVLKERIQPGEFEFAGYTTFSGGKFGLPSKSPGANAARPSVHQSLQQQVGPQGMAHLQKTSAASFAINGVDRMAKCFPKIMHNQDMETNPALPIQYPRGSGIMQIILTVKKNFLLVAEVDATGTISGMNGFSSQIAPGVPYEQRVAVRKYLEAA